MIKELLEKYRRKKELQEEMENEDRISNKLIERKKNSNERELERYMEEERQKRINNQLKMFRKKRNDEYWRGSKILDNNKKHIKAENIFKDKPLFKNKITILKDNGRLFS